MFTHYDPEVDDPDCLIWFFVSLRQDAQDQQPHIL